MTQQRYRTAAATAAVRRKKQERYARELVNAGWLVYTPEDRDKPWDDGGLFPPLEQAGDWRKLHADATTDYPGKTKTRE